MKHFCGTKLYIQTGFNFYFLKCKTTCIQFKYLTFTLLTTLISCKRTILHGTWIYNFPPRDTVIIISITWNVFKVTTALTLWSKFSARCWIWTSGLTFGISVPLTTNAFRSNHWVSLCKLCNFGSWSESMENLELKWRFICTHKPNNNVLIVFLMFFRLVWLIGQCMGYFQHTHQGYKVKREDVSPFERWQQPEFASMGCVTNFMSQW